MHTEVYYLFKSQKSNKNGKKINKKISDYSQNIYTRTQLIFFNDSSFLHFSLHHTISHTAELSSWFICTSFALCNRIFYTAEEPKWTKEREKKEDQNKWYFLPNVSAISIWMNQMWNEQL